MAKPSPGNRTEHLRFRDPTPTSERGRCTPGLRFRRGKSRSREASSRNRELIASSNRWASVLTVRRHLPGLRDLRIQRERPGPPAGDPSLGRQRQRDPGPGGMGAEFPKEGVPGQITLHCGVAQYIPKEFDRSVDYKPMSYLLGRAV